jgi:hypothetical protein
VVGRAGEGLEEVEAGHDLRVVTAEPAGDLRALLAVDGDHRIAFRQRGGRGRLVVEVKAGLALDQGRRTAQSAAVSSWRKTASGRSPFSWLSQRRSTATAPGWPGTLSRGFWLKSEGLERRRTCSRQTLSGRLFLESTGHVLVQHARDEGLVGDALEESPLLDRLQILTGDADVDDRLEEDRRAENCSRTKESCPRRGENCSPPGECSVPGTSSR